MIKLLDILLEERRNKESIKKSFNTYYCEFLVRIDKKINKTQAIERIRGIKSVTVVDAVTDPKIEILNKNLKDYEYGVIGIKFITNKDVNDQLKRIGYEMAKADSTKDVINIKGIITAKPRLETLKKII
jgi:hypothetical protein